MREIESRGVGDPHRHDLASYLRGWLAHHRERGDLAPTTLQGYERNIALASQHCGHILIEKLAPRDLDTALEAILQLPHLSVGGLMTVGRLTSDPLEARRTFRDLRATSELCRGRWPTLGHALSMGMSDDFELAIEEGATLVRVGRALFGERPHVHGEASHTHGEGGSGV
jgi:hypothetical protein